jgi:bifunctional non-homologous end joining protein LigD
MPEKLEAQVALLADQVPAGEEWLHEIKFDGYRMLARIDHGQARMISRNGNDWTAKFPEIAKLLPALPVREAILDGEVCYLLPTGVTGFGELQAAIADERTGGLVYFIFDLLYLDGWGLSRAPLIERKALLTWVLEGSPDDRLRYTDHHVGQGPEFFAQVQKMGGIEGIVSKRTTGPYRPGRGSDWLKIKAQQREEFIVIGWTDPEGSRVGFGRLVLAYYSEASGGLAYAGAVGTNFSDRLLAQLRQRLDAIAAPDPGIRLPRGVKRSAIHWVRPEIIVETRFSEWTRDGILRHPAFLGERMDKSAGGVVLDRSMSPDAKQHHWSKVRR